MLNVMKAHMAKTAIGCFAFDDSGKMILHSFFDSAPEKAAEKLALPMDDSFLSQLSKYEAVEDNFAAKLARKNMRKYALALGFCKNDIEFNKFMGGLGMALSRNKLGTIITKDLVLVQASNSLDSLSRFVNIMTEHFKEWFWLNYPEYKGDNEKIISAVATYGSREKFPDFSGSYGIRFEKKDEALLKEFAVQLNSLMKLKKEKDSYVRSLVREVAPNFSYLIDELLAARMIASAGSMEKISRMPSGAIQLIGAEKAMFRHMKNRQARPPKYGMIFESTFVKNAPEDKKGKAARIVASSLFKAIKIDFYSKRDEREHLKKEMEKELGMIR